MDWTLAVFVALVAAAVAAGFLVDYVTREDGGD